MNDDDPRPCRKCDRPIFYVKRWYGRPPNGAGSATLNAEIEEDDRLTWLEISRGVFIRANHHHCPGKPNDELQKEREKLRKDMGLDMPQRRKKPIQPKLL